MTGMLLEAALLLSAAVLFVPLAHRLGFGAVLGYLIAGVIIGPFGFKLIEQTEQIGQVSELGVVFLLFIIGLELDPKRLWSWRVKIFGMGTAQIVLISAVVAGIGVLIGLQPVTALVIGLGLAQSSTAISSQILRARHALSTPGGSSAFSILLFQDMAVIPILAMLPLLAGENSAAAGAQPVWKILLVIGAVIGIGHFLLRHVFRVVASVNLREVFTALSLLLVVGLATLMHSMGVSMGLGAFLGGVLLATSEYRHAIETDIEPFKGLLLGLFFMSVGMSVDLPTVTGQPLLVVGLIFSVIVLKILSHGIVAWFFGMNNKEVPLFALVISQVGEFSFVLFAAALTLHLISPEQNAILSAVVAVSMGTTPLLISMYERFIAPHLAGTNNTYDEEIVDEDPEVIIAGFGRVGQIVGRILYANGIRATVLDHDPDQIEALRRFGFKVYYGDATRMDLLIAAGAAHAKILVVAVDGVEDSLSIVDMAQLHFKHLRLVVRARNVQHVYQLIDRGVEIWERETFDSSLRMGTEVLQILGWSPYLAVRAGLKFRKHSVQVLHSLHGKRSNEREMLSAAKQAREDLAKMFAGESENLRRSDESWDIHPQGR